jgi:hypothetical protein
MKFRFRRCAFFLAVFTVLTALPATAAVTVRTAPNATPRELYGAQQLRKAVAGIPESATILVGQRNSPLLARYDKRLETFWPNAEEAFILHRFGPTIIVAGYDASGTLYGALELADRINAAHALPAALDYEDHPSLKLRAFCIGMQKPEITYEGAEYDYPYTPQNFPFFYDKSLWTRYLDMLAGERINALFLWNGHPFTSLLKLPRYPEAQELSDAQLQQNIAMFRWLTSEADRRGIWIIQGFYNIHLSHTFARAHHLPYHLSAPNPLATAYTRYAISEFIREYPHVGLMMTLGEALSPHEGAAWLTQAIIPGVKDGLAEIHSAVQPPIVVRAHATDIDDDLKAALPLYSNIDTMAKWNGESLTWTNVRGPILDKFKDLVSNSNIAIANIHLLSNLEPFRWGDPDFIRQIVLNFQRIGIGGVHVYPLRYWDWPITADKTAPPLLQIDRDWIWFGSWGRYAWNPNRDPKKEQAFWAAQLADRFGTPAAGEDLLRAYALAGPCQPRLLPRIGITEGNRQAFALGMTMPELIDATRFGPAETLWTGDAPKGERLAEYVEKEVKGLPREGETPLQVADEVAEASAQALAAAEAATPGITKNRDEYERIVNDMRAIHLLMLFYQAKTRVAEQVMLYGHDHNKEHLQKALPLLEQSVADFQKLTDLTDKTYRDAAALHTSQRRIPVTGGPDTLHWRDLLPVYQKELNIFRGRLANLRQNAGAPSFSQNEKDGKPQLLPQVTFTLAPNAKAQQFMLRNGEELQLSTRKPITIANVAPELQGMKGIRVDAGLSSPIHFTLSAPAQVLVAFLRGGPENTDAESWNPVLFNAITTAKNAPLTAWAKPLPAGDNDLDLSHGTGVVLGFVPQELHMQPHAAAAPGGQPENLDWLFEN